MTTLAHPETVRLAKAWEGLYPSAVCSGIVGDPPHMLGGGYHLSLEDNAFPTPNYSETRPDDAAPPGKWPRDLAAAIDMSMNTRDMIVCHLRLRAVFLDHTDPRRIYLNGWNGWDGTNGAGRYDIVANTIGFASDDHKWHVHLEIRRRWVTSRTAMDAIWSILAGHTKQQYLDGEAMALADDPDFKALIWRVAEGILALQDPVDDRVNKTPQPNALAAALKRIEVRVGQPVDVHMFPEEIADLAAKLAEPVAALVVGQILEQLNIPTLEEIEAAAYRGAQRAETE